jgi:hypothetical protein
MVDLKEKYLYKRTPRRPPPLRKYTYIPREQLEIRAKEVGGVIKCCPICKLEFVNKPDLLGQFLKVYCSRKCRKKADNSFFLTGKSVSGDRAEVVKKLSRMIYCPDTGEKYSSVKSAARILGIMRGEVYLGLNNRIYNGKPPKYRFVDYDHKIHPMPRHRQPWLLPTLRKQGSHP